MGISRSSLPRLLMVASLALPLRLAADAPLTVQVATPAPPAGGYFKMGSDRTPDGHVLSLDSQSLRLDGHPWTPVMGEFQYARYPAAEWREELLKMKAGGIDIVATYVTWIHHEETEGKFDWSGQRDLRAYVQLCGQLGLKVMIRCGPWIHGEARNGGFPDWVVAHHDWKLRTTDPNFLAAVKPFYAQVSAQLRGLLWKDGGPVIGIQLDNEYTGPSEYLLALKKMARDAGIDVPIYSRTGWPVPSTPMPTGELVPFYGSYGNAFWYRDLSPALGERWTRFCFSALRTDTTIGTDQLGKRKAADEAGVGRYPYCTTEIGDGMASSYHRRILFQPLDALAVAMVQLGSGANLPGYYPYHGGSNPDGLLTTLNESQASGYPNDLPVKNYDFQAPLGEFGEVRPHYHLLRRMHLFLHDFGPAFAETSTFLPDVLPTKTNKDGILRWAVRSDGRHGFLFVNNHQQIDPLPPKPGVQFDIHLPGGDLTFPAQPVTIPTDACFLWPFHFDLGGVDLTYATAQPVCAVDNGNIRTLFFAETPGIPAEFAFDPGAKIETPAGQSVVTNVKPGTGVAIRLHAGDKTIQIVLLSEEDSLALWKGTWRGRDRVFLSRANLVLDGAALRLASDDPSTFNIGIYPPPDLKGGTTDGIFTRCEIPVAADPSPAPRIEPIHAAGPLRQIPMGKGKTPVAVAPTDADFANAAVWRIELPPALDLASNPILRIHYTGDVARITLDGRLIQDDFYNGNAMDLGLRRFGPGILKGDLRLAILPLQKNAPIYMAAEARPDFGAAPDKVEVKSIEIIHQYEATLPQ